MSIKRTNTRHYLKSISYLVEYIYYITLFNGSIYALFQIDDDMEILKILQSLIASKTDSSIEINYHPSPDLDKSKFFDRKMIELYYKMKIEDQVDILIKASKSSSLSIESIETIITELLTL